MVNLRLCNRLLAAGLLCALGVLAGWIWRQELEWRSGWPGLAWIGYFHWAVPIGGALFVAWAAIFADVPRRWLFTGTLAVLSVPVYWFVDWLLRMMFAGGPMLFAGAMFASDGDYKRASGMLAIYSLMVMALPILWPFIPVALAMIAWLFGARPRWTLVAGGAVLFLLAWPLAILARMLVEDIGGHDDPIHAVKSGFIVPFLFVALGIPILSRKPDRSPTQPPA